MRWLIPILAGALGAGCGNECDFFERCDGDVVEVCGGADQVVNRKVERTPCAAPNPVCVEIDEHTAMCVTAAAATCDAPRCDGDLAVNCVEGYEVARDCVPDTCSTPDSGGGAVCAER
jgi:hypothetical protein